MPIESYDVKCIAIDIKSLNENDVKLLEPLQNGFCISFPNSRTKALDIFKQMIEYKFSEELIDFVYSKYLEDYKIISLSKQE